MSAKEQKSATVRLSPPHRSPLRGLKPTRPGSSLKAIYLTPSTQSTLQELITQAAARTGRKTSASAVVRAFVATCPFFLSRKNYDLVQILRPFFECLTNTLCYAA
jgi:hypothetical protein